MGVFECHCNMMHTYTPLLKTSTHRDKIFAEIAACLLTYSSSISIICPIYRVRVFYRVIDKHSYGKNLLWKQLYSMLVDDQDFRGGLVVKSLLVSAEGTRDTDLIPGLGRSPAEGNGNPLQHSCLGNPMDRGSWWAMVHGVTKESEMT